ncbi:cysteine desulfurase family protein [Aquifex aeolicus]|uniref:FeS cluster formation protein NifS n=1 Tax=Aquifex aeolicus (strain VF5) TaxID=224324 RepID=O67152_AQUAE|nr:cysteine desulfurase family protein [Aquifex aeolicus]AAC07111.1 FeS cluster formation protein NifS [Aquifex aeolicus VF5]
MIYFDNAATTPVLPEVKNFLCKALDIYGNPSSVHTLGKFARSEIETARKTIANYLKVKPENIIFNSCATEGNNTIIRTILNNKDRGNVVLSAIEHKSVKEAIKFWANKSIEIREIKVNKNGVIDLEHLYHLIDSNTILVCVMYVSNEFGTIQPIQEIAKICSDKGVPLLTDAVQAIGKIPIELKNISYATFSGHKFHAIKGSGFLYISDEANYEPLIVGGGQENGKRSGTENVVGILSLAKALEIIVSNFSRYQEQLKKLRDLFENLLLEALPDAQIVGKDAERSPSISSVIMPKFFGAEIVNKLSEKGIYCSTGSACLSGEYEPNKHMLKMGFSQEKALRMVRFSFGLLNKEEEVIECIERIKEIYRLN